MWMLTRIRDATVFTSLGAKSNVDACRVPGMPPRLSPSADISLAAIDLRRSDAQSQSSLHHETHGPVEKVCRSWLKETYTPIFGLKVQASSKHNIAAA